MFHYIVLDILIDAVFVGHKPRTRHIGDDLTCMLVSKISLRKHPLFDLLPSLFGDHSLVKPGIIGNDVHEVLVLHYDLLFRPVFRHLAVSLREQVLNRTLKRCETQIAKLLPTAFVKGEFPPLILW